MKKIHIQINIPFSGYSVGQVVPVKADDEGVPLDQFWRNRLRDAPRDGCVEVVRKKRPPKAEQKAEESQ